MSTPAIDNSGKSKLRRLSFILKICVFATGCAAMVTEYTLATLASYLLGDSIRQWTIVISLMLFSMGLGSRYSRKYEARLLDHFVGIEFGLSFLCTFSAMFCFWISGRKGLREGFPPAGLFRFRLSRPWVKPALRQASPCARPRCR